MVSFLVLLAINLFIMRSFFVILETVGMNERLYHWSLYEVSRKIFMGLQMRATTRITNLEEDLRFSEDLNAINDHAWKTTVRFMAERRHFITIFMAVFFKRHFKYTDFYSKNSPLREHIPDNIAPHIGMMSALMHQKCGLYYGWLCSDRPENILKMDSALDRDLERLRKNITAEEEKKNG